MQQQLETGLSEEALKAEEQELRRRIEQGFTDGSWIKTLPGRDILKHFVAVQNLGVSYEVTRNLIVGRMAAVGYKPIGMQRVIAKVVAN